MKPTGLFFSVCASEWELACKKYDFFIACIVCVILHAHMVLYVYIWNIYLSGVICLLVAFSKKQNVKNIDLFLSFHVHSAYVTVVIMLTRCAIFSQALHFTMKAPTLSQLCLCLSPGRNQAAVVVVVSTGLRVT